MEERGGGGGEGASAQRVAGSVSVLCSFTIFMPEADLSPILVMLETDTLRTCSWGTTIGCAGKRADTDNI
jgi:hypothetical protein